MRHQQSHSCFAASALAALATATPVRAHHAFAAEFDSNQPITLRGAVTRVEWINPHTWIHLDVKDASGKVIEWMIEGGTPNTLAAPGRRQEFAPRRNRNRRRGLPRQERHQQGERQGPHAAQRAQVVPRLVGDRRSGRRQGSHGERSRPRANHGVFGPRSARSGALRRRSAAALARRTGILFDRRCRPARRAGCRSAAAARRDTVSCARRRRARRTPSGSARFR